jgi:hypothetical protein
MEINKAEQNRQIWRKWFAFSELSVVSFTGEGRTLLADCTAFPRPAAADFGLFARRLPPIWRDWIPRQPRCGAADGFGAAVAEEVENSNPFALGLGCAASFLTVAVCDSTRSCWRRRSSAVSSFELVAETAFL